MATKSPKGEPEQTRVVTNGSTIRIEQPQSNRGHKPNIVISSSDEFVGGFLDFLREHAVVGLAIGFVIGVQAQTLVKQLVDSFINPAFTLFFGQALTNRHFTLHFHDHEGIFNWGAFVYGLMNFIFVMVAIYALFKYLKLDKLDKPKKKKGTEAPFTGKLLNEKGSGDFVCAACGQVVFKSDTKFDSGSGWPSFYDPANTKAVKLVEDTSHGMRRTEVICANCGSHLGHMFEDAPDQPTGQRFCINSAALDFKEKS